MFQKKKIKTAKHQLTGRFSLSANNYVCNTPVWQLADKRNWTGDMAQIWSCVRH